MNTAFLKHGLLCYRKLLLKVMKLRCMKSLAFNFKWKPTSTFLWHCLFFCRRFSRWWVCGSLAIGSYSVTILMKAAEQCYPMARALLCSRNKFYVWICGSNPYVSLFNKKLSISTFLWSYFTVWTFTKQSLSVYTFLRYFVCYSGVCFVTLIFPRSMWIGSMPA